MHDKLIFLCFFIGVGLEYLDVDQVLVIFYCEVHGIGEFAVFDACRGILYESAVVFLI